MILERRKSEYTRQVMKSLPKTLRPICRAIFGLRFHEKPPYEAFIDALKKEILIETKLDDNLQPINHKFEWSTTFADKYK
jgi:hypothetical protein